MALWAKAQALPSESLQQIRGIYGEHFPIEVRHFLAQWIEEKMWANIDPEMPQHEQYVAGFVSGLVQELETKAASMNSADMFITKIKLIESANMFKIVPMDDLYTSLPISNHLSVGAEFHMAGRCNLVIAIAAIAIAMYGTLLSAPNGPYFVLVWFQEPKIQRYAISPLSLFQLLRHCLNTELKIVQQVESFPIAEGMVTSSGKFDAIAEIARQIDQLRQSTQQAGEALRKMEQDQEAFAIHYHDCTKTNAQLQTLEAQPQNPQTIEYVKKLRALKPQQEQRLNQMVAGLMQLRLTLAEKLQITVNQITSLQARVLEEELINWKREQQLAGNGNQFNTTLDNIQEWCENLAEIIWLNRQQIKELERLKQKLGLDHQNLGTVLPDLNSQITQLLSSLVTSTFIIEKQPPQVIKTNLRFTSSVRLLVGGKLNVHMTPPQVKVTIISEAQAKQLLKNDKVSKNDTSGEIINSSGTMEFHPATRQLSVSFRNMQLKKIKRAEKKGTEIVLDEKFSLLFQSQFSVGGGELVFHVWTLSLPVAVTVHGSQDPHAWATITWDNAFAEAGRVPFAVPEKVPWKAVAEALNMKFRSATGRFLTEDNLRFLAEKAFKNLNVVDYSSMLLSWSQFCKEPLAERNFTFWEWFYAVMKLTREHLREPWSDGRILGFVQKKQTEDMLSICTDGTFLLRFSDSELGGVTIAWVGNGEVYMLQPFTHKDFTIRSLPDRIADLQQLLYLYPDIPKDDAFGKYYSPRENNSTSDRGYKKTILVTCVPGLGNPGQSGLNYPNTPQSSYFAPSPDPSYSRDTPSVNSQFSETVSSFSNAGGPVADMELPPTDDYDFHFDFNELSQNQTIAGVTFNNSFSGF